MNTYRIEQFSDDLYIYNESVLILTVKRNFRWTGVLISTFYQNDKKIFESSYDDSFWSIRMKIRYSEFEGVELVKIRPYTVLSVDQNIIYYRLKVFSKTTRIVYLNGKEVGKMKSETFGFFKSPLLHYLEIEENEVSDIYVLLRVLIDFPTIYA